MAVLAHHPGTGAYVSVTTEQLDHMRASGWLLASEHEANQAAQQAAADAAAKKTSAKSADGGK